MLSHHYSLLVTIMLVLQFNQRIFSNAQFAEYPSNISLTESEIEAVFRCRHQSVEALIIWLVNGLPSGQFPDITTGSIRDNGNFVSTLTIPTRSEYDGTEIVCEAYFLNGSPPERTYSVLLTIMTECITSTVTMMTNNFIETPFPPTVIVTMEERHVYICNNSATDGITWRVNGSVLWIEIFPQSFDDSIIHFPDNTTLYTLTIGGRPEHNVTTIQCVASFSDGSNPEVTPAALFLMQGSLGTVTNLNRIYKSLVWTAPFSLDLTNVDPDVIYCVEVYNITCGRSLLISECDVMETSYTNDALLPGYIYEYTVTPRSNVEGASYGISQTVTERFITLILSKMGYVISMINTTTAPPLRNIIDDAHMIVARINLDIDLKSNNEAILPSLYMIHLDSLDGLMDYNEFSVFTGNQTEGLSSVILEISPLPIRRLLNVTVFALYCGNHQLTPKIEVGTHDIYNISILSSYNGGIVITGNILDESLSMGAFVIIYSLTNDTNTLYKFAPRLTEKRLINSSIVELPIDEYKVSAFIIKENKLPLHRVAALPRFIHVNATIMMAQGNIKSEPHIQYDVLSTSTGVCVTCTFLKSSTTDCVAVVHQRISQLSSSGLMNIESSHKFNRSGDTAYGCIEGVNLKHYQVGVMEGVQLIKSIQNHASFAESSKVCVWCIFGTGLVLTSSVLGIIAAIYLVRRLKMKRETVAFLSRKSSYSNDAIEMKKCGAYKVIQLTKERVIMEENPAYGEVGTST